MPLKAKIIKTSGLFFVGIVLVGTGIFLSKYPAHQVRQFKKQFPSPPQKHSGQFDADRANFERELFIFENMLRINYAQTFGGLVGGLVILVGIYLTWRNLKLAEDGKITDRYSNAIAQLGNQNMTVRIGGIFALERIARDSEKDHWTVMEALCAFIRDESTKVITHGIDELHGILRANYDNPV